MILRRGPRLCFDVETNGLLPDLDRLHCLVTQDLDTGEVRRYHGDTLRAGVEAVQDASLIVGHNIIGFDIEAIKIVYPWFNPTGLIRDTLLISWLIWTNLRDLDFRRLAKDRNYIPKQMTGRHGLEAWGHRLGYHKGDYSKEMKAKGLDPWAEFNEDMLEYCVNDVALNVHLWELIQRKQYSERAIALEHAAFNILRQQMAVGCGFDEQRAATLYASLVKEREEVEQDLKNEVQPWYRKKEHFVPKRPNKTTGYVKDAPMSKIELIEFNPASRHHIIDRLKKLYGWKPRVFTDKGHPTVDEKVLAGLKWPIAKKLTRYLLLDKRIGQIAEGKEAWLKLSKDGRIFGRINVNGAITGRCTHNKPNLAQVPASRSEYGPECRALFIPSPGWKFIGADASGLELRCLAHYMAKWDGGAYVEEVLNGDVHTANQKAAGLPSRDAAKTFIYAFLYGAGNATLGSQLGKGTKAGKEAREKFLSGLPALDKLIERVKEKAKSGRIRGLDGRQLVIRSEHAALNTLLQGAGAVIMKQAMVNFHDLAAENGLVPGVHYRQVLFVHDELQCESLPEYAELVGQLKVQAIRQVTDDFDLKCPLDGEYKVGDNWYETH